MKELVKKLQNGITLTELLITVFLLGVLAYVMPVAIKLLNGIKYQQQMAQSNQQIETFIALISRDINNCPKFETTPSSTTLQLYAIDNKQIQNLEYTPPGYTSYWYTESLNPASFGHIQYQLIQQGKDFLLRRTTNFPMSGTTPLPVPHKETKDFLKGLVLPPGQSEHPIFTIGLDNDTVVLDLSFYYPYQRKTDPPKRFVKNILKWSNYLDQ